MTNPCRALSVMTLAAALLPLSLGAGNLTSCPAYQDVAKMGAVGSFDIDRYAGRWFEVASRRIPLVEGNVSCTYYDVGHDAGDAARWRDAITLKQGPAAGGGAVISTPSFGARLSPDPALPGMLSEGCFLKGCDKPVVGAPYWVIDVVEADEGAGGRGAAVGAAPYAYALVYSCVELLPVGGGKKLRQDFVYLYSRQRTMPPRVRLRFEAAMLAGGIHTEFIKDTEQAGCTD